MLIVETVAKELAARDRSSFGRELSQSSPEGCDINDQRFIRDLDKLKDIRSFFIQEAVPLKDTRALSFGKLNLLRFSEKGRPPTEDEYEKTEEFTRILVSSMTDSLRRKYRLGTIPWSVAGLPVIFAIVALASITYAIHVLGTTQPAYLYERGRDVAPFYLIWLLSLGAIGALAFIGMNALSIQEDITFDPTNMRLTILRVVLGGLFGLVLTLPFGFQDFLEFCKGVAVGPPPVAVGPDGKVLKENIPLWQAMTLLMPFVLGFSTSLVILVLNQLVEGIQAFFGKRSAAIRAEVSATPRPVGPGSKEPRRTAKTRSRGR